MDKAQERIRMRRRSIVLGLAAVFAIAAALPAIGAPSPAGQVLHLAQSSKKKKKKSANTAARALKLAKQATQQAKIANSISNRALAEAKLPGAPGATGKTGPAGKDGTARAYAETKTPGSTVALVTGRTKNFTAVTWSATGVYCLTIDPATNIDSSKVAAVASPEGAESSVHGGSAEVLGAASATDCTATPTTGQFEVKTYDSTGAASDGVAFNLIVP